MYFFETIPEARVEKGGYKLAHIHVQVRHLFKSKSTLEWNVDSDEVIGREREREREEEKDTLAKIYYSSQSGKYHNSKSRDYCVVHTSTQLRDNFH